MSVAAQARPARMLLAVRPRLRPVELLLLSIVVFALVVGAASLGATQRLLAAQAAGEAPGAIDLSPPDPRGLALYLGALFLVHLAFVLAGRRTDQVLLPAVGMLAASGCC